MIESTAAGAVLAKFGVAIGGFVGAILSLGFLKDLSRKQAAMAVITGFCCSVFTTPFFVAWLGLPNDQQSRYGVAFIIGFLAMNLIPAIKTAANRIISAWGA